MILSPAQAKAVYAAMCELNNIGARLDTTFPSLNRHTVRVFDNGLGVFVQFTEWTVSEKYPSQAAFADAYKLNSVGLSKDDETVW